MTLIPALNLGATISITSRFTKRYGLKVTAGFFPEANLGLNLAVTSGLNPILSLGFSLGVRPAVKSRADSTLNLTALLQMLCRAPRQKGPKRPGRRTNQRPCHSRPLAHPPRRNWTLETDTWSLGRIAPVRLDRTN